MALAAVPHAAEPTVVVACSPGAAVREATPVHVEIDLAKHFRDPEKVASFFLEELRPTRSDPPEWIPGQFEPQTAGSSRGAVWWLMPPAVARERRFRLLPMDKHLALTVKRDASGQFYDLFDGDSPVLRYNHGVVPVPPGIGTNYARGDYIMPLFGPSGEVLTDDYPKDHPHHRGVGWSWPVTRWGAEVRDIWAVLGVWARPVAMRRIDAGSVFGRLEAENVWKWGDTNPIVREEVLIRAFGQRSENRLVDVEVRLTALADGVAIGGRPHGGYGGFGLRAQPAQGRVITRHTDASEATPRRSWLDYSGVFAKATRPAGIAIFEHVANPLYPNTLIEYPELNYVMPAFPGEREVALSREKPLVLKHRLWIHAGMAREQQLAEIWTAYAYPPKAKVE